MNRAQQEEIEEGEAWMTVMEDAAEHLEKTKRESRESDTVTVIDAVFDFINDSLSDDPSQVDVLLNDLDVSTLQTGVIVGIVTATHPAKDMLSTRDEFVRLAKAEITERGEWEDGLFDGFNINKPKDPMSFDEEMEAADEFTRGQFIEAEKKYTYNIQVTAQHRPKVLAVPIKWHSDHGSLKMALVEYRKHASAQGKTGYMLGTKFIITDDNDEKRTLTIPVT